MFAKSFPVCLLSIICLMTPAFSQEVETSKRIAWKTSVVDAFAEAVDANKPLVLVFLANPAYRAADGENFSNRQWVELDELSVHQLAGDAVFAQATFDQRIGRVSDENANRVFMHLKITELPFIAVIAPRTDELTVLHGMEGFFSASDVASDLRRCFTEYAVTQALAASATTREADFERPKLEFNPYEPDVSGSVAPLPSFSTLPSRESP